MSARKLLLFGAGLGVWLVSSGSGSAESFSLDDNPSTPAVGYAGFGLGAEDPFGVSPGAGLAPSPSVALGPLGDGTIFSPGPVVQHPGPNGFYVAAFSANTADSALPWEMHFSVDRVTVGAPGTAVAVESGFDQAAGDIFIATELFAPPASFVGGLGPGPFAGSLGAALGVAPGGNVLGINQDVLGLLAGGVLAPAGVATGPIGLGTHDNVDAFEMDTFDIMLDGTLDIGIYLSIYPDEAIGVVGTSPADLFFAPAGSFAAIPVPFATAPMLGLDSLGFAMDSIDALAMFDRGTIGPDPSIDGGPTVEPGIDYALFSLSPGSATLTAAAGLGISAGDIFFTDFTGAFGVYASAAELGLLALPGAPPFGGDDNVDALDVRPIPEPSTGLLVGAGVGVLALLCRRARRSLRRARAAPSGPRPLAAAATESRGRGAVRAQTSPPAA